jgi:hypothetical protein
MSKSELKELVAITIISLALFLICVATSRWMLPEHCQLFDDNIMPTQMCHTIPMPADCHFCKDRKTASAASIIATLGIVFSFFHLLFLR